MTGLGVLARFVRPVAGRGPAEDLRCELCAAPVASGHRHVVDLERRGLSCVCPACAFLFREPRAGGRYRTVPERVLYDPALHVADEDWLALGLPVRLAFLVFSSRAQRHVATLPGPAGAVEAELGPEAVSFLADRSPLLVELKPDVEAVLVRGGRSGVATECLLCPIDVCYELVALVRRTWRGFDGGEGARRDLDAFFGRLRARGRPVGTREGIR